MKRTKKIEILRNKIIRWFKDAKEYLANLRYPDTLHSRHVNTKFSGLETPFIITDQSLAIEILTKISDLNSNSCDTTQPHTIYDMDITDMTGASRSILCGGTKQN